MTRYPNGLVRVDYENPERTRNIEIRENIKTVNPNTTIIYNCPVMFPGRDSPSPVLVIPDIGFSLKRKDVVSSPQAGGIMHVVDEVAREGTESIVICSDFKYFKIPEVYC